MNLIENPVPTLALMAGGAACLRQPSLLTPTPEKPKENQHFWSKCSKNLRKTNVFQGFRPCTAMLPQPPHSSHDTPATAPATTLQPSRSSHNTPATTLQTKLQPQLQPRHSSHHTPATILQPRHSSHNSPATAHQTQSSSHNTQHVWGSPAWIIQVRAKRVWSSVRDI